MFKIVATARLGAAIGRRDHQTVIALCEEAIRKNPKDTVAMTILARTRERLDDHQAALELNRRIVNVDPSNINALRWLAAYYVQNGEERLACEAVRRALAADRPIE